MKKIFLITEGIFLFLFFSLFSKISQVYALCPPPTELLPYDGLVVANPISFSWKTNVSYSSVHLNVSFNQNFSPLEIDWRDNGAHYYLIENPDRFPKGTTLYWRLNAQCTNGESVTTSTRSLTVGDFSLDPYYLVVNIGWPGGANNLGWEPHHPETITSAGLEVLKSKIGSADNFNKKLAFSFVIPFFSYPHPNYLNIYKETLQRIFTVSEETDLPVLIALDAFEWWEGRPDLWNWWIPSEPGFNPENRNNVEWKSWSNQDAVWEGWRNWGVPFKVGAPHPNLTSPTVIRETKEDLQELVPLIRDWYYHLPEEKKYLFAGIKLGWEINIGINYFYPLDESEYSPCAMRDAQNCSPFKDVYQIGYAAVKTAGIKSSGQLTVDDLNKAVGIYINELAKTIYEIGIPRSKIFTHLGPDDKPSSHPNYKFISSDVLSVYAHPGFSFYTYGEGPLGVDGISNTLEKINSTFWSVSEWGGPGLNADYYKWRTVLTDYYNFFNNKFLNSYVEIANDNNASNAYKDELKEISCWLHPPIIKSTVNGQSAILSWSVPSQTKKLYLNISTNSKPSINGGFEEVDVLDEEVTGFRLKQLFNLPPRIYYWKLFAEGCEFGGKIRKVISDMGKFEIQNFTGLLLSYNTNIGEFDLNFDSKVNTFDFGKLLEKQ